MSILRAELKEGDEVKLITSEKAFPEFFPAKGTVGKVIYYNNEKDPNGCWVEWPAGSLKIPEVEGNSNIDLDTDGRLRVRYCLLSRLSSVKGDN